MAIYEKERLFLVRPLLAGRYVWIIDDDVMPGSKFLQQLNHIAEVSRDGPS